MPTQGSSADTLALDGTRGVILDAAQRRFIRFGPRKTSMNEIAQEAGLARATLYLHFRSKKELYAALLEDACEVFLESVRAIVASDLAAPVKMRQIVDETRRVYAQNPVFFGALAGDPDMAMPAVAGTVLARHEADIIQLLRSALLQGVEEGSLRPIDPEAVSYLMYQLGNLLLIREVSGQGDFEFERILRTMDDVIAHGILFPEPETNSDKGARDEF